MEISFIDACFLFLSIPQFFNNIEQIYDRYRIKRRISDEDMKKLMYTHTQINDILTNCLDVFRCELDDWKSIHDKFTHYYNAMILIKNYIHPEDGDDIKLNKAKDEWNRNKITDIIIELNNEISPIINELKRGKEKKDSKIIKKNRSIKKNYDRIKININNVIENWKMFKEEEEYFKNLFFIGNRDSLQHVEFDEIKGKYQSFIFHTKEMLLCSDQSILRIISILEEVFSEFRSGKYEKSY